MLISDPVWQIKWNPISPKNLGFYSISSDGRVLHWVLMKDKLECEEIMRLKLIDKKNQRCEEDTALISLACGLCFDFSPFDKYSFILGTEEGNIHKCSTAYSGQFQMTYEGHQLAVYKVLFNCRLNTTLSTQRSSCLLRLIGLCVFGTFAVDLHL